MKYGTIFSMDLQEDLRLMAVGPVKSHSLVWYCLVLIDPTWLGPPSAHGTAPGWKPGTLHTFTPGESGIVIIKESPE